MKLNDIINKTKIKTISETLDIKLSTLYRWINNEQIDKHIKFIELLIYLNVDIEDFVKQYKKDK